MYVKCMHTFNIWIHIFRVCWKSQYSHLKTKNNSKPYTVGHVSRRRHSYLTTLSSEQLRRGIVGIENNYNSDDCFLLSNDTKRRACVSRVSWIDKNVRGVARSLDWEKIFQQRNTLSYHPPFLITFNRVLYTYIIFYINCMWYVALHWNGMKLHGTDMRFRL